MNANFNLTAIIKEGQDGFYIGYIEEIPGVLTQGKTIEETKENLKDALELWIEVQRAESENELKGTKFIREELFLVS